MNTEENRTEQDAQQAAQQEPAKASEATTQPQNETSSAEAAGDAKAEKANWKEKRRQKPEKQRNHEADLQQQIEQLQKQLQETNAQMEKEKDRLLRMTAEYDNFRKRTEREKNALYAAATADAVQEFLPVADNLERALDQKDCTLEDLRKGVEMVQKQMEGALQKLGVKPMGKPGEPFDADLHNAVSHIESEELGENVIAEVYQKGYLLGDKVVRHAMVQVAN